MRNMKEELFSMGEKLITNIGDATIKISDQVTGKCLLPFLYEPKVPIEVLKQNIDK